MSIEANQGQSSARASYRDAFNANAEKSVTLNRGVDDDYILTHYNNGLDVKPPGLEDNDPEEDNINAIQFGAKAINLNNSAAAKAQTNDTEVQKQQRAEEKKHEEEERRMAAWENATSSFGGEKLTNREIRDRIHKFNENPEQSAQYAVDHGIITADRKEDLKRHAREEEALDEKIRSYISSGRNPPPELLQRQDDLRSSPLGQDFARTTREMAHDQKQNNNLNKADQLIESRASSKDQYFASAPKMNDAFSAAAAPNITSDIEQKKDPAPIITAQTKTAPAIPGL